jgi:hypothetical protein
VDTGRICPDALITVPLDMVVVAVAEEKPVVSAVLTTNWAMIPENCATTITVMVAKITTRPDLRSGALLAT